MTLSISANKKLRSKVITLLVVSSLYGGLSLRALAQNKDAVQTVVTQGIGKDVEAAAKNAAENALIQVVGSFVQTETSLKKRSDINNGVRDESRSIETKTREYSQGSIKGFEILEASSSDGLIRVNARVDVRLDELKVYVQKLAEAELNVSSKSSADINQKLTIQELEVARKANAREILSQSVLAPIVAGQAIEMTMGELSMQSDASIRVPMDFTVNKVFLENVTQTLEAISSQKKIANRELLDQVCAQGTVTQILAKRYVAVWISKPNIIPTLYFIDIPNFDTRLLVDSGAFKSPDMVMSIIKESEVIKEAYFYATKKADGAFTISPYSWGNLFTKNGSCIELRPTVSAALNINKIVTSSIKDFSAIKMRFVNQ